MRTRATRLWALAVLPLLAGLFAMHGVQAADGGGHAMAMPMVASGAPSHAEMGHPMPGDVELAAHSGHGHDDMMCLALLVLTLLALALTHAPWLALVRQAAVRLPRTQYRRPSRDPPVYLRLCVFRL